ncbi:hypothetical protein PVAP13_6NG089700 [Panicum virgatum]|uniref:F-box domain-containing protein n=1 Tax=Panicum virgatum TaxID=38727 RepID=A0A8T0QWL4_PANVG|nr:hypothetical protein PVAP13_6NG089700 [Panicum virgatum]
MEEAPNKRTDAFANLMDDVVVEILRFLPGRSLFYCKLVCKSWKRLILDSKYLKLLPQTMADFFYDTYEGYRHFTNVTGEPPSLKFLRFSMDNVAVSDCCNGLILC